MLSPSLPTSSTTTPTPTRPGRALEVPVLRRLQAAEAMAAAVGVLAYFFATSNKVQAMFWEKEESTLLHSCCITASDLRHARNGPNDSVYLMCIETLILLPASWAPGRRAGTSLPFHISGIADGRRCSLIVLDGSETAEIFVSLQYIRSSNRDHLKPRVFVSCRLHLIDLFHLCCFSISQVGYKDLLRSDQDSFGRVSPPT